MAFSTTTNKALYSGNGVTTAFAAPFLFYNVAHIEVYLVDKTTGVSTLQTLTTNYTVSGTGVVTGGTVTMLVAPPSTVNVLVRRIVPQTQAVDLKEGDKFPPDTIEQSFDLGVMLAQQLAEVDSRAIKLPPGTSLSNIEIPDIQLVINRGKVIKVNSTGDGFETIEVAAAQFANPLNTKGDIPVHDGASVSRLPVGADGTVLEADSVQAKGIKWGTAPIKKAFVTAKGDLISATGSGIPVIHAVGPNGNVLMADSSQSDGLAWAAMALKAQCRLDYVSATSIKLSRFDGQYVPVKVGANWEIRSIPSAGITAANTGIFIDGVGASNLAANTIYYVYLFDNAGVLTLDYSVTAYAADATTGVMTKSAVSTRTLVGMVRTNASSQFIASEVLSWFNKRTKVIGPTFMNVDTSTASTAWVEFNTTIRNPFISWANEMAKAVLSGTSYNTLGTSTVSTGIVFDTVSQPNVASTGISTTANYPVPVGLVLAQVLSEGGHFAMAIGHTNAGNGAWRGGSVDAADYSVMRLMVEVLG